MNKILLNQKGRNHIKVMLIKDCGLEMPEDELAKVEFCQKIFATLQQSDDAIRHYYYRNTKKGYQITVYQIDDMIYLTNCIRDLDRNYISTIYVSKNLNDLKNIAKFLRENIETMMNDYKNQILEGKEEFDKLNEEGAEA